MQAAARPSVRLGIAFGVLISAACLTRPGLAQPGDPPPYYDLSKAGAGFPGPGRDDPPPSGLVSVRLGLLGPGRSDEGARMHAGVTLAVEDANARGGYHGLPYETIFRPDDGPWGVGAKQVTALAYEDSVWAILGGLEGGDAHIAELVAAKVWIPVVTPTAADMTIDYANVPWVFRCFPSDDRQARLLLGWVREQNIQSLLVLSEANREGRTGWRRLEAEANDVPVVLADHREFEIHLADAALDEVEIGAAEAILVWARPESSLDLIQRIRGRGYEGPILGPATLLSPGLLTSAAELGKIVVAAPYDLAGRDRERDDLRERYRNRMGSEPDPIVFFSYDAASLVILAIEQAGLNRARIRDALDGLRFEGVTGVTEFNGLGGSTREPVLMRATPHGWTLAGKGT